jgi:uncharacterized protein YecE (DUF72 family)
VKLRTGTSGFSYAPWKGPFYPEDLPSKQMLSYYASKLPSVEINNTFYRMPKPELLASWAREVPPEFSFALKASQQITHRKRLKECAEPVEYFFRTAGELGAQLGPTLFQLPPNLKKDVPRLVDFLKLLPPERRCAFEFRHETWFCDETWEALRAAKAALCIAEGEDLATPLVATADWGYLRLRRQDYDTPMLRAWSDKIAAQPWQEVWVFFKHEDSGIGPKLALELASMFSGAAQ